MSNGTTMDKGIWLQFLKISHDGVLSANAKDDYDIKIYIEANNTAFLTGDKDYLV